MSAHRLLRVPGAQAQPHYKENKLDNASGVPSEVPYPSQADGTRVYKLGADATVFVPCLHSASFVERA